MKRWGTITTEETNGRGSAAPYAEMGFSAGDSAVVGHFAVAALSSAPKPHTNNGGGGDTAATATNLHHCPTLGQHG
ncbi:MAG: hypothetical protein ACRD2O_14090, partial [Terriglobia bacterium]